MDFDPTLLRKALENFIHDADLVVNAWEDDAGVGDGALRKFLSGASNSMSEKTYQRLAASATRKLGRPVLPNELRGMVTEPAYELPVKSDVRHLDPAATLPQHSTMTRDVPVFGTLSGSGGGLRMGGDQALDYVRRPPRFRERTGKPKDIFAVLVEEVTMLPKYGPGDLLYIDPLRKAQVGDSVVVEIREDDAGESRAILMRLAAQTEDLVSLEQYNPPRTIEVKPAHIVHLFRVMTLNDLLGA